MEPKKKQPSFIDHTRHLWRVPTVRYPAILILALGTIALSVQLYTAYYIYEDGRCFWADCKILKGQKGEMIQIGDD